MRKKAPFYENSSCDQSNVTNKIFHILHLIDFYSSIGSDETSNDIVLKGGLIESRHCVIHLKEGIATLIPHEDAMCMINAESCQKPTRLYQGCVIVLGKTNMFR